MKYLLSVLFLIVSIFSLKSQYRVDAYMDQYKPLESYKSIAIETMGKFQWAKEFDLGFRFPYFDTSFNALYLTDVGVGGFEGDGEGPEDEEFTMHLASFGYRYDNVLDTVNIESDVVYAYGQKNGIKYLVIEYKKIRLSGDPSIKEFDSHVNFQYWFFEDGAIEIRFGKSNLDNSDMYIPGSGFNFITDQGLIRAGPWVELNHPFDRSRFFCYIDGDNFMDFEVSTSQCTPLDWWPDDGWVIRFNYIPSSIEEIKITPKISLKPNPVSDILKIDWQSNVSMESLIVFDYIGNEIYSTNETSSTNIDVSSWPGGIYFIKFIDSKGIFHNSKFIKI